MHKPNTCPHRHFTIDHTNKNNNAFIHIIFHIENKRFERLTRITIRRRNKTYHLLKQKVDIKALFRRNFLNIFFLELKNFLELTDSFVQVDVSDIDLVNDRHDLKIIIDRQIIIGHSLRLNTLRCINDQQRPFTGFQRLLNLIGKIYMSGSIDQIEQIFLAILGLIGQTHRRSLDSNTPLTFKVHIIQHLILEAAFIDRSTGQHKPVR